MSNYCIDIVNIVKDWEAIPTIINNITAKLHQYLIHPKELENIRMVLREVIENIVKYAIDNCGQIIVVYKANPRSLIIKATNKCSCEAYAVIKEELIGIEDNDDLESEYMMRMVTAARHELEQHSRMGFIRMAYEGNAKIQSLYDDKQSLLTLIFNFNLIEDLYDTNKHLA